MFDLREKLGLNREMTSENIIRTDVFRYKRNKLASGLALLGLFINCLYLMLFYGLNYQTYANPLIGLSVLCNLVVLLVTFLASEGVKVYNKKYCWLLLAVAVVQIVRIFIYPLDIARGGGTLFDPGTNVISVRYFGATLGPASLSAILIIYLVLSAGCILASAVIGYIRAVQLESFNKGLAEGKFTVEGAIAEVSAKEEAAKDSGEVENA